MIQISEKMKMKLPRIMIIPWLGAACEPLFPRRG